MPYKDPIKQKAWLRLWEEKNKEKRCLKAKQYYLKNKETCLARNKEWRTVNKQYSLDYKKRRYWGNRNIRQKQINYLRVLKKKNPWYSHFYNAKTRCENKNRKSYIRYGGRGIKFTLDMEQIRFIWFRDRAFLMSRPSLDRLDNNGNYCVENCRFMEFSENTRKGNYEARWARKYCLK